MTTTNIRKRDVTLTIGDKAYALQFSFNALCLLEDQLNRGYLAIMADMASWREDTEKVRVGTIRALLWAAVQDHHPDIDILAAGELVESDKGNLVSIATKINEAFMVGWAGTNGDPAPGNAAAVPA
jgi:hypothetical protein